MSEIEIFTGLFEEAFRQWVTTRSGSNKGPLTAVEAVMTVPEFCTVNKISMSHFFKMKRAGHGPREIRAGGRVLISPEANRDWRLDRERRDATHEPAENAA